MFFSLANVPHASAETQEQVKERAAWARKLAFAHAKRASFLADPYGKLEPGKFATLGPESERELDRAIFWISEAVKLEPENAAALHDRANIYGLSTRYKELAYTYYSEAMKRDPKNGLILFRRALLSFRAGNFALARADFDEVIKRNPKEEFFPLSRADLLEAQGEYELAIADYDTYLRSGKSGFEVEIRKGKLLAKLGRLKEANKVLNRYLKEYPFSTDALEARAEVHERLGEKAKAKADINLAAKIKKERKAESESEPLPEPRPATGEGVTRKFSLECHTKWHTFGRNAQGQQVDEHQDFSLSIQYLPEEGFHRVRLHDGRNGLTGNQEQTLDQPAWCYFVNPDPSDSLASLKGLSFMCFENELDLTRILTSSRYGPDVTAFSFLSSRVRAGVDFAERGKGESFQLLSGIYAWMEVKQRREKEEIPLASLTPEKCKATPVP